MKSSQILLIGFLCILSLVSALRPSRHQSTSNSKKQCSLTLEKIIYSPLEASDASGGEFIEYADELLILAPLLFTPNNASIYWNLQQKHNIAISVFDGFSNGWIYSINPTPAVQYVEMAPISANYARSFTNHGGFSYQSSTGKSYYTFNVWNKDGQLVIVTFSKFYELVPTSN